MVDAIVVVLVSNGCLGHVGLFIPKVKLIQDVKVKMALLSKQYILSESTWNKKTTIKFYPQLSNYKDAWPLYVDDDILWVFNIYNYWFLNTTVNGSWGSWGQWRAHGACSNTCGKGRRLFIRQRTCTRPAPRCSGRRCPGPTTQNKYKSCFLKKCVGKLEWLFVALFRDNIT